MHNPWIAVAAAGLAAWIFGAVYYGVLGKTWQRAQGLNPDDCKDKKMPIAPMVTSLVSEWVMAAIFLHILMRADIQGWMAGAFSGLLIGIAFMTTTTLVNNMFQQRKLMLTVIDSAHWIGVAVIEGVVLMLLV